MNFSVIVVVEVVMRRSMANRRRRRRRRKRRIGFKESFPKSFTDLVVIRPLWLS
jgi:hypothetical protein